MECHKRKVEAVNSGNELQCQKCTKTFSVNASLTHHMKRTHDNPKDKVCDYCEKNFYSQSDLERHMKSKHGHTFKCPECGKELMSRSSFNIHVKTHASQKPYQCDQCDNKFSMKSDYMNHVSSTHKKIHSENKDCEHCNKMDIMKMKIIEMEKQLKEMSKHTC